MAKQSPKQQAVIGRVMAEFKRHALKAANGEPVTDRRQAVAIGLSEAGASRDATPARNARARARSEATLTRADLYEQAKARKIPGRSRMTKAELEAALG